MYIYLYMYNTDFHKNNVPASESFKSGSLTERIEDIATQESVDDLSTQQLEESVDTSPTVPPPEEGGADANRPSTPPLMNNLMEMGFTRPQINVAMERYMNISYINMYPIRGNFHQKRFSRISPPALIWRKFTMLIFVLC